MLQPSASCFLAEVILGTLIMIVVWLALIAHFFDCGLLKGLVVAVIAGIIYVIISWILSAILAALGLPTLPSLWPQSLKRIPN